MKFFTLGQLMKLFSYLNIFMAGMMTLIFGQTIGLFPFLGKGGDIHASLIEDPRFGLWLQPGLVHLEIIGYFLIVAILLRFGAKAHEQAS